jgi:uncharacterized membrane protein
LAERSCAAQYWSAIERKTGDLLLIALRSLQSTTSRWNRQPLGLSQTLTTEATMNKTIDDLANRWLKRKPDGLSQMESRVLQSTLERTTISRDTNKAVGFHQTFGDRVADTIARIGGSWSFILTFIAFLILWTSGNVWLLSRDAFDPYPFIFLNLVLSMIAALQAPVIMMSQNRQTERDRIDAAHDYEVNLKAEIEIMALHEKLDELRHSEIIGMRDEILRLAEQVRRIDEKLSARQTSS